MSKVNSKEKKFSDSRFTAHGSRLTFALTGGFGSGKSTVLEMFKKLGAETVDCDKIARELTSEGNQKFTAFLAKRFGKAILMEEGAVHRKKLAELVFADSKKLKILEAILHPKIINRVEKILVRSRRPVRVVEVPLLFEAGLQNSCDANIVVRAGRQAVNSRLKRQGWTAQEIRVRSAAQMPLELKCKKADFILDNSGSRQKIFKEVKVLYHAALNITNAGGTSNESR